MKYTFPIVVIIANVILCSVFVTAMILMKRWFIYIYFGVMATLCLWMIFLSVKEIIKIKSNDNKRKGIRTIP